jgi:hypothetical protein
VWIDGRRDEWFVRVGKEEMVTRVQGLVRLGIGIT